MDFDNFLIKSDTSTGLLFEHRQKSYTFVLIHVKLNFVNMKLKSGISILLSFLFVLTANATLTPVRLTCEYLVDPSVIDARHPRLSWINTAAPGERGQQQTAYQIRVASSADKLKKAASPFWFVTKESRYNRDRNAGGKSVFGMPTEKYRTGVNLPAGIWDC